MKKLITLLLMSALMLSIAIVPFSASAERVAPDMEALFEKKQFTTRSGYLLNYCIYLPNDYDPSQAYPVVLYMHGAGERGDDLVTHISQGIIEPFKNTESPIYGCIVVAPQCPQGKKWVNVSSWKDDCIYSTEEIEESEELAAVVELVGTLKDIYSTDTNRYYVTGLSMGGYATWDLLVRHPEIFAAAMPLCGGVDRSKASVIKDIPVWAFHGFKDPTVPYTGTKQMCARMKDLGGTDVTYTEYPDLEHNIWDTVYAREDIWEWLLSKNLTARFPELAVTDPVTEQVTDAPTVEESLPATHAPTTVETPENSGGCGSVAALSAVAALVPVALCMMSRRKED